MEKEATIIDKLCVCGGEGRDLPLTTTQRIRRKKAPWTTRPNIWCQGLQLHNTSSQLGLSYTCNSENVWIFSLFLGYEKNGNTWDYNLHIFTLQNDVMIYFILNLVKTPSVGFAHTWGPPPSPAAVVLWLGQFFLIPHFFSYKRGKQNTLTFLGVGVGGGGGKGRNNDERKTEKKWKRTEE